MTHNSNKADGNKSNKFEIDALVAKYQGGDEEAFNALVHTFKKYITRIAGKIVTSRDTSVTVDELITEGVIALEAAAKKHQLNHTSDNFPALASYLIKRAMINFISESSLIKIPKDRRVQLNNARKYLSNAEMLKGRTLTHEEKLRLLMEKMREQYVAKNKERKLYLDAKYLLEEIEVFSPPSEILDTQQSDASTPQDIVEDALFVRLVGNKLKGLDRIHLDVAVLIRAGYRDSEIKEKLSITSSQFNSIVRKIRKTLLEDDYIRNLKRYSQRKYKWTRGEKKKSKYRQTRYSDEDLSYLEIRLSTFYQDAEKISSSSAPKFNRLKMFNLAAEHIGKTVVDMSTGEKGEITEKVMYDHFNKIISLFPKNNYENHPDYKKYVIPVLKDEKNLPMESYVFFAALMSSYLEDDGSGTNLKGIIKSKNFIAKDYWAWRAKMLMHLHELMEKCIEYMCNEALVKYNADKINAQSEATTKKKIEQISEVYELASEQVKSSATDEITDLTFKHHRYYDDTKKISHFRCFETLLDIVMSILSKGKAFYADENDLKLQDILAKLNDNPNKKSTLLSLENHLKDTITDYQNGSEDAESHLFDVFAFHRNECEGIGTPEIKRLITEIEDIVNESMHETKLNNAESHATELVNRYKRAKESKNAPEIKNVGVLSVAREVHNYLRDYKKQYETPVLEGLLTEMANIESEHRGQLESAVADELRQQAGKAYEARATGLINDYKDGTEGSHEAISDFLLEHGARCAELDSPQINILIEKMDAIIAS